MKKRMLSCLLVLALLLPMGTVFAATLGTVALDAYSGETITLTIDDFEDAMTLDPGEFFGAVQFPQLPDPDEAIIYHDGVEYQIDPTDGPDEISYQEVKDGDLTILVTADPGTVTIDVEIVDNEQVIASGDIVITVSAYTPIAKGAVLTVEEGEKIPVTLEVENYSSIKSYTFTLSGDDNLQHGVLTAVEGGNPGEYTYTANEEDTGTDTFTFTVTADGNTSDPATVSISVTESSTIKPVAYRDMPTHWAAYSAGCLARLDLITGHDVGGRLYFHPDRGITRGDFLIWLCAVADLDPNDNIRTIFVDKDLPDWMAGFVYRAAEEGIVNGVPVSAAEQTAYFYPNEPITKIEAIKMISACLGVEGVSGDLTDEFKDLDQIPSWGSIHVRHLLDEEIIQGNGDGYLMPGKNLSRGEAAEMLYKCYKALVKQGEI